MTGMIQGFSFTYQNDAEMVKTRGEMPIKYILTSEWSGNHLLAGQNTQQLDHTALTVTHVRNCLGEAFIGG